MTQLVLSLFPGIGLLDRAFEEEGFCVVRGPDLLWGGDVKRFFPPAGRFDGIIGGSPCQCFSRLVHIVRHNGYEVGENLVPEFERVIHEAQPSWWVMENVIEAPVPTVPGYLVDPSVLDNRHLGEVQSRKHRFSFGTRDGRRLHYETAALVNVDYDYRVCASEIRRTPVKMTGKDGAGVIKDKRTRRGSLSSRGRARKLPEMLELQGLPRDFFDNSPFTMKGKGEMLGNGVPLFMGRCLARAIKKAIETPAKSEAA